MSGEGRPGAKAALRRDVLLSVLIGPLGTAVPVAGYLLLVPIIIRESGLAVLGIWSLLSSFSLYLHTADVGFSLLLKRDAGPDRTPCELATFHRDRLAARRLYLLAGAAVMGLILAAAPILPRLIGGAYPPEGLLAAALILAFGTTIEIAANLDAAVIAARSHNHVVQLVKSLLPVPALAAAIAGALIGMPLEGFALGRVLKGVTEILVYRWWIARHHQEWLDARAALPLRATWGQIRSLVRRGWQYSMISWLTVVRDPAIRLIIGALAGLPALGAFEVAFRMVTALRNALSTGLTALFPAMAQLHRQGDREGTVRLIRESLYYLLGVGAGALGFIAMAAGKLIYLWLGELPEGVVFATQIAAVWVIVGLVGIPYYYLLQAIGRQLVIVLTEIVQLTFLFVLFPAGLLLGFGLEEILIYWAVVLIGSNILMLWWTERLSASVLVAIHEPKLLTLMGIDLAVIAGIMLVPGDVNWVSASSAKIGAFFLAYAILVSGILWSRVKGMFFTGFQNLD